MIDPGAVSAFVDGEETDPCSFIFHYQANPYPGGHIYRFLVRDPGSVQRLQARFGHGEVLELKADEAWFVLSELNIVVSFLPGRTGAIMGWFANTVSRMEISPREVTVEGVCSPRVL